MGCFSSRPVGDEKVVSKKLDQQLVVDNAADVQISKLLLLGAGESGKSTLFKQLISIHGNGFSEADRKGYVHIIHSNTIQAMRTLCEKSELLAAAGEATAVSPSAEPSKRYVLELVDAKAAEAEAVLSPELAGHMDILWHDPGILRTYELRARFQLTDSANYFFGKLAEISNPVYVPSEQDLLRSRVRTTGIIENSFIIDHNQFKLYDVGGQRNERKKWIHCFSDVTAVLFVAALSEYDMVLFEDEHINRMHEAVNLFRDICNSQWFKKTSIILMLNKSDLFDDKITKVPLTVCFPDYVPPNPDASDAVNGKQYIQEVFENENQNPEKTIFCHITCATNRDNVTVVFNAVKSIVINQSLREGGLLA